MFICVVVISEKRQSTNTRVRVLSIIELRRFLILSNLISVLFRSQMNVNFYEGFYSILFLIVLAIYSIWAKSSTKILALKIGISSFEFILAKCLYV